MDGSALIQHPGMSEGCRKSLRRHPTLAHQPVWRVALINGSHVATPALDRSSITVYASAGLSRSGVIGARRSRTPGASKTALARAAAMGRISGVRTGCGSRSSTISGCGRERRRTRLRSKTGYVNTLRWWRSRSGWRRLLRTTDKCETSCDHEYGCNRS